MSWPRQARRLSLAEIPVADARAVYRAMRPINPELSVGAIENAQISGPSGAISIRIYRPEGDGPFGTLVYFHGGGWVIGDMDTCDSVCRELATLAGLVVVAVDYRKAPNMCFRRPWTIAMPWCSGSATPKRLCPAMAASASLVKVPGAI